MPDLMAWPTDNHPLNAADAERSKERVSNIERGLTDPIDGQYWRQKLEQRIQALDSDASIFGLVPHEEVELRRLKALQDQSADEKSRLDAGDRRRGYALSSPPPSNSTETAHG